MSLLSVGDKLGGRYFIIAPVEQFDGGVMFEVRDGQGAQAWAQVLAPTPIKPSAVEVLAKETTVPVPGGAWLVPAEVLATQKGIVAAVFPERPPKLISEALTDLAIDPFRPKARARLINWFAALAEALHTAHAVGATHGSISLSMVRIRGEGELQRLVLSGIGLEAARRMAIRVERAPLKVDLAALVVTLAKAMEVAKLSPEGNGTARWNVLLQCARGGDHPAFSAGRVLAVTLRELASAELEPPRRSSGNYRKTEKIEKPEAQPAVVEKPAEKPVVVVETPAPPEPPKMKVRPPVLSTQDFASLAPPPMEPEKFWTPLRLRVALVMTGALVVSAAVVALKDVGKGPLEHDEVTHSRGRVSRVSSCGDESVQNPTMMDLAGGQTELSGGCSADTLRLTLVTRSEQWVVTGSRRSRRGGGFESANTPVAGEVAELGTAVSSPEGVWVAWLQAGAVPFGVARIDRGVNVVIARMPGWPTGAFHGAFMLRADASGAYIASTLRTSSGSVVTVVRAAFEGSEERSVAYALGAGEVIAVIPGDDTTLLVREGNALHTLRIPVTTLAVLAAPTSDAGAVDAGSAWFPVTIGVRSLPRSAALEMSTQEVTAARTGAVLASGKTVFLVTDGAAPGRVILAEFPAEGDAAAVLLTARGRGESLVQGPTRPTALYFADAARRAVFVAADGAADRDGAVVFPRAELSRLMSCGGETWMAFVAGSHAGAVPLSCVHEQ